jgi:hypothetical protein
MLALFLFGQGFGPGAHTMTFASLSYPTSLRGVGVGLNQTLMRSSSTLSLFLFPLLVASLDTPCFGLSPPRRLLACCRCSRSAGSRRVMTLTPRIIRRNNLVAKRPPLRRLFSCF